MSQVRAALPAGARIIRRSRSNERELVIAEVGMTQYSLRVVAAHGANSEIVGYHVWVTTVLPSYLSVDDAIASTLADLVQLQQQDGAR